MVNLKINGIEVEVLEETTILDAAKKVGIEIPTLCDMYFTEENIRNCKGSCRICMVEETKTDELLPACSTNVKNGMDIKTHSYKAVRARKSMVELMLSNHPIDCLRCNRNLNCELQKLAKDYGIQIMKYTGEKTKCEKDTSSPAIIRDMNKCILCRRCVTICSDVQTVNVLTPVNRGMDTVISTFNNKSLEDSKCVYCGQCVIACPTGALTEVREIDKIWEHINNKDKIVIAEIAPAVRVALGEEFSLESGDVTTKKIVTALKKLGFDKVYDTNFAADLTVIEEAYEFIKRYKEKKDLPLITSCCPSWVRFCENEYHGNIKNLSSCKSPQQMFGAIAKTYLTDKYKVEAKDIIVVSIMPCLSKKYEAKKEEMYRDNIPDVDVVITTRELSLMLNEFGIDLNKMDDSEFDSLLGISSGAASLFGATGGVMEAALRTAYEVLEDKPLDNINFKELRNIKGFKKATINIGGNEIKVAAVSSLKNARRILYEINNSIEHYDFVEIMACPGGCINGGGQPYIKCDMDKIIKRMDGIYSCDREKDIKTSQNNPMIIKLYNEFLKEPNGALSKKLLHTKYKER